MPPNPGLHRQHLSFRIPAFVVSIFMCVASAATVMLAHDWPQFRGPDGQGHSVEQGLPSDWSESRNVVWKTPIPGLGWSSPVVADGRVWLTAAIGQRDISLRALAFDVETGRELVNAEWFRIKRPRYITPKNSWASPTPIVEGDGVCANFGADGTSGVPAAGDAAWL